MDPPPCRCHPITQSQRLTPSHRSLPRTPFHHSSSLPRFARYATLATLRSLRPPPLAPLAPASFSPEFELQLGDHVKRTNLVFENRYKQYMEDMSTSALLLKELGLLVAEPSQPQQKAIVLATAGKIVANATADAPGAVAESPMVTATARFRGRTVSALTVAKTALIELSKVTSFKQLMERASSTQTPATCTKAWDHAFSLYKSGHGTCVCVVCDVYAVYVRCMYGACLWVCVCVCVMCLCALCVS